MSLKNAHCSSLTLNCLLSTFQTNILYFVWNIHKEKKSFIYEDGKSKPIEEKNQSKGTVMKYY